MKGLVMKSTGSWYDVLADDGRHVACRTKGKLRLEDIKETNPVAVGDRIEFEKEGDNGMIFEILPRHNHMLRQSVKKTGHAHVLAANIDQVLLLATLRHPRTSMGFIDRFLVSAESFRIPQILLFNKADLLTEEEVRDLKELTSMYQHLGIQTYSFSALTDDLLFLSQLLDKKITLIAGHSGVGKSTLLNQLSPEIRQSIAEISEFSSKGVHTTTFAEMFMIAEHTYLIDTPGVKEWGLVNMEPQEISDYFPEMRELRSHCRYGSSCLHQHEPQCAILEAVEKHQIALSRYESYLSMVEGEDNRK